MSRGMSKGPLCVMAFRLAEHREMNTRDLVAGDFLMELAFVCNL